MDHRLIRVPTGIGDNIWLAQKLVNQKEKFHFQLSDAQPQRGKQIFDVLPQITASCVYTPGLSYQNIYNASKQFLNKKWSDIKDKDFALAINHNLENGKRIEEFLPDLKTSFRIKYDIGVYDTEDAGFDIRPGTSRIGVYTSGNHMNKVWNGWNSREWFDLLQKIYAEKPNTVFYIIGAKWDLDLGSELITLLESNNIPAVNVIDQPLGYCIGLMKLLDYFIGFPSGMPILNESLGKDTFMFYPEHLKPMMYAWADEKRIKEKKYMASLFCSPLEAFIMIKNGYQLFDKL